MRVTALGRERDAAGPVLGPEAPVRRIRRRRLRRHVGDLVLVELERGGLVRKAVGEVVEDASHQARLRAFGTGSGSMPGTTRFEIVPSPSTVIVTTSAGASGGGSRRPALPPELAETAAAARPGPEQVSGADPCAARSVGDQLLERPRHVGERVRPARLAVHRNLHVEVEAAVATVRLELVPGHDPRPQRDRRVLALRRAEANLHLGELEIARRPVVEDGVTGDVRPGVLGARGHGRRGR